MKSMEALKCDFCGGGLIIDDSREFAKCEFCGTKYMANTLRAKIQEIRGTVKVEGAVETTTGNTEKERLNKNVETLLGLKRLQEAKKIINTLTDQFPDDYRSWFFAYQISLLEITPAKAYYKGIIPLYDTKCYSVPKSNDSSLESALKLCNDSTKIEAYFIKLMNEYGNNLHLIKYSDADDHDFSEKYPRFEIIDTNGIPLNPLTIDSFTVWLLFGADKTCELLQNEQFCRFREKIANLYLSMLESGQIIPYMMRESDDRWIAEPITVKPINKTAINPKFIKRFLLQYPELCDRNASTKDIQLKNMLKGQYYFIGRFIHIKKLDEGEWRHSTLLKMPQKIQCNDIWKANYLCQHCGGDFKGVFSKICSKCGRPKDY